VSARVASNIPADQLVAYADSRIRRLIQARLTLSMALCQATDFSRFWVW